MGSPREGYHRNRGKYYRETQYPVGSPADQASCCVAHGPLPPPTHCPQAPSASFSWPPQQGSPSCLSSQGKQADADTLPFWGPNNIRDGPAWDPPLQVLPRLQAQEIRASCPRGSAPSSQQIQYTQTVLEPRGRHMPSPSAPRSHSTCPTHCPLHDAPQIQVLSVD